MKELTKTATPTPEQERALRALKKRLNVLRRLWGKPMIVTSGLRSMEDHLAIYRKLGMRAPLKSAHLSGEAADIYDRDGQLAAFLLERLPLLEKLGLYIESPTVTRGWVHFQTRAPRSGRRVFLP